MDMRQESLKKHREWQGKLEVVSRAPITSQEELALAYTPGVAEPCLAIARNPEEAYALTRRGNLVAVVTDGSAVLGLGNIGALAGMPVMEGKCALFKTLGGVDAFPICLDTQDTDALVRTIACLAPSFGGINLEDIAAPRCFEVEARLSEMLDIPVFHDDQHGTAIVVGAALLGALKVAHKDIATARCVINGAGSAGIAIAKHLDALGVKDLILVDKCGVLSIGEGWMNPAQAEMATITNPRGVKGTLADAVAGADVLIGVSAAGAFTPAHIASMAPQPIVFAMANPTPEIMPDVALAAGAAVVGTGRSDFANQINNVLAFPGLFRGALDVRASKITREMKVAATYAIAALVTDADRSADYIIPSALDPRVAPAVAAAVREAAHKCGVARLPL